MSGTEMILLNINNEQKSEIDNFINLYPITQQHVDQCYLVNEASKFIFIKVLIFYL